MTPDQQYNRSVLQYGPPDAEIVRADGTTTTSRMLTRDELASVGVTPRYADLRTGGMLPKQRANALRAFLVVLAVMVAGAFIVSGLERAAHDAVAVGVEGVR